MKQTSYENEFSCGKVTDTQGNEIKKVVKLLLEQTITSETKLGSERDRIARRTAHPTGALKCKRVVEGTSTSHSRRKGESNSGLRPKSHVIAPARPILHPPPQKKHSFILVGNRLFQVLRTFQLKIMHNSLHIITVHSVPTMRIVGGFLNSSILFRNLSSVILTWLSLPDINGR